MPRYDLTPWAPGMMTVAVDTGQFALYAPAISPYAPSLGTSWGVNTTAVVIVAMRAIRRAMLTSKFETKGDKK